VAAVFLRCGELADFEEAFYHSAVNFTTLGYRDIVMSREWRLLGPLEALNDSLMLGLAAALLFAVLGRFADARPPRNGAGATTLNLVVFPPRPSTATEQVEQLLYSDSAGVGVSLPVSASRSPPTFRSVSARTSSGRADSILLSLGIDSLVVLSPITAISSARVNSDMSNDVTSGLITKSAGWTPTAFMLWFWINCCLMMTWIVVVNSPTPLDCLLRMPMKSFLRWAVTLPFPCSGRLKDRIPSQAALQSDNNGRVSRADGDRERESEFRRGARSQGSGYRPAQPIPSSS
jgi:hypothetical protein